MGAVPGWRWRPLGELLVAKGLIAQAELESALDEQRATGKRLGEILVRRGLVSGPDLTIALMEQRGVPLTTEEGFGSGLWVAIKRRYTRAAGEDVLRAVSSAAAEEAAQLPAGPEPSPARLLPVDARVDDPAEHPPAPARAAERHDGGEESDGIEDLRARVVALEAELIAEHAAREAATIALEPEQGQHTKTGPEPTPQPAQKVDTLETEQTTENHGQPDPPGSILFVPSATGYKLIDHDGHAPPPGASIEIGDSAYTVTKLGRSPLPLDQRTCAYLQALP